MKLTLVLLFLFICVTSSSACSCFFDWNDSFKKTAKNSEFVALVKVLSFDEYLVHEVPDRKGKMPYSMTVEIVEEYKGKNNLEKIKIFGDNGMLCRSYLSDFEINGYYLTSPSAIDNSSNTDFEFLACGTEYLKVDMEGKIAYGKYSLFKKKINLNRFQVSLEHRNSNMIIKIFQSKSQ